eukprot:6199123-Pleurochrysis_carterae.AAC.1
MSPATRPTDHTDEAFVRFDGIQPSCWLQIPHAFLHADRHSAVHSGAVASVYIRFLLGLYHANTPLKRA